ncbi:MAG: flippase-like domain-containing protein [Actinobacteria bacterium]|nr:MAG: flippase-like domain-containing protein [Actinomycetota bacterium]
MAYQRQMPEGAAGASSLPSGPDLVGGPAPALRPPGSRRFGLRTLLYVLVIVVTVAFSVIALRDVDFHRVGTALEHSDYYWLLPALAAFGLSTFVRALRWHSLFAPGRRPPVRAVGNAMLVGYLFNNIFPARAGEAARVVVLRQRAGTPTTEVVGTVVVERVFDVLSILVIFFVASHWLPHVSWFHTAAIAAIVLAVGLMAVIAVLVIYGDRPVRYIARPLGRLPLLTAERVESAAADLVHGLAGLHRPWVAFIGFFWSIVAWVLSAVSAWLVTYAFALHLGFDAGVLVAVALGLAMILPSPPAAVGVFEAAALLALNAYGFSKSQALPYALVLHVLNFVPFLLMGLLALHFNALHQRRRTRERAAESGEAELPAPA